MRKIKLVRPRKQRNLKEEAYDQDYIDSLPTKELKEYIRKFNNEYYRASNLYNKDSLHNTSELKKAASKNRAASDREVYLDVTHTGAIPDPTAADPLDALIEMYDKKFNSDDE